MEGIGERLDIGWLVLTTSSIQDTRGTDRDTGFSPIEELFTVGMTIGDTVGFSGVTTGTDVAHWRDHPIDTIGIDSIGRMSGILLDIFVFCLLRSITNPTVHHQRMRMLHMMEKISVIEFPETNKAQEAEDFGEIFLSRKILRSNPISSFPIFMPNTTLRRRDCDQREALSSWTMRLSERISAKESLAKSTSGVVPLEVRRSFGKDGFFFNVFHRSREEPERTFIFFSSSVRVSSPFDPRTWRAQRV